MPNGDGGRCFRALSLAVVLILMVVAGGRAQVGDLPSGQRIEVAPSIAERLNGILPFSAGASTALGSDAERVLVGLLPESSLKSCGDLVEAWGPGRSEAVLTARWLHGHRDGDKFSVLIVYRCSFRPTPHFDATFDERLALLVRNGTRASLMLISPYRPEECCDPHSVELLKTLSVADGQLLELGMQSMSHGDGPDSSSRYELVWVLDPAGQVALKVDSRTEFDGYDADTEESHESVCTAQVRYEKDGTGKLTAIVAETTCTQDKVKKPSETVRYVWDAGVARFSRVTSQTTEQTTAGR